MMEKNTGRGKKRHQDAMMRIVVMRVMMMNRLLIAVSRTSRLVDDFQDVERTK